MTFIIGTDAVSFVLKGSVHRDAGSFVVKASNIKRQTRNFKTKCTYVYIYIYAYVSSHTSLDHLL